MLRGCESNWSCNQQYCWNDTAWDKDVHIKVYFSSNVIMTDGQKLFFCRFFVTTLLNVTTNPMPFYSRPHFLVSISIWIVGWPRGSEKFPKFTKKHYWSCIVGFQMVVPHAWGIRLRSGGGDVSQSVFLGHVTHIFLSHTNYDLPFIPHYHHLTGGAVNL